MKNHLQILLASLTLMPLLHGQDLDIPSLQKQVLDLGQLTQAPARYPAEGFDSSGEIQAIFYDTLPWKGKPTRAFAWLGIPRNLKPGEKLPAMVLVHGGGGTAFKTWVEKWNARGFAAISIAVEGQTDRRMTDAKTPDNPSGWERHKWGGPARQGIYGDSQEPLPDQWMFHAVADTILAHSLIRSLEEVDPAKVGLMGVSWGGVITSTVMGIDDRFAFAIPVYGCGHLADAPNQYGRALGENRIYREVWDPMIRIQRVNLPVLWFSWPQDLHFPLDDQAACYRAAPGPRMVSLVPGMGHGHGPPWTRPEAFEFAQHLLEHRHPWLRQQKVETQGREARVVFESDRKLDEATLIYTLDLGMTGRRGWQTAPAALHEKDRLWEARVTLPDSVTGWFINVRQGGTIASSDYQESTTQP